MLMPRAQPGLGLGLVRNWRRVKTWPSDSPDARDANVTATAARGSVSQCPGTVTVTPASKSQAEAESRALRPRLVTPSRMA